METIAHHQDKMKIEHISIKVTRHLVIVLGCTAFPLSQSSILFIYLNICMLVVR